MIAAAHQDANLPTEMSENMDASCNTGGAVGLTQAMMMIADQSQQHLFGEGMFDISHSALSHGRIPGKISKGSSSSNGFK